MRMTIGMAAVAAGVISAAWAGNDDLVRFVHTEMGTINTGGREGCAVSTGNLFPMVARPWGFGGWTPQTRADGTSRWFYDYNDERICGIRYTRQPSPWIGDHAAWNFMPVTGEPAAQAKDRASWYSHKTEHFGPDRYSVYLADYDVTAEIAPALHGAVARLTYAKSDRPGLVVNPFKDGTAALSSDGVTITGFSVRNANHRGWGAPVKGRFVIRLSRKAVASRRLADGALYVAFAPTGDGEQVEMRIAVSLISDEQALVNLRETEGLDLDALAREARGDWNDRLGRIRIASGDEGALATFYTCFFRTMLFPLAVWERAEDGTIRHWSPSTGETRPGSYYAGTGFWDTFRALFPLLNFLAPEMNARMMEGLQHCWEESGWLPEWSSPGLSNCMIGNNSASVVADAWLSGVRGNFDIHELWKAVAHGANNAHPTMSSVGRAGVKDYIEKGYVPRDVKIRESAARTLEYAYDDWCIAELAQAIGRPAEEVATYRKRSGNWRNVFDPSRKIAVGRNSDGSFNKDFNRFAWGGDFTEGCALHYTWSVFHDVNGLMAAMGGAAAFERRLDEIFSLPPTVECSAYGSVIHEAREMQIMNFGQYAHGNQPIQHAIYLFDWCGAWPKAQHWAREVMDRLYKAVPDGYCGDEDNGQTSAWYVWSALGMYPVCPASGEYALGAPRFDEIKVALPSGKTLAITAKGAAERQTFGRATLNGEILPRAFVRRDALAKGGSLAFTPADVVVSPQGEVKTIEAAIKRVRELRAKGKIPASRAAEVLVEKGRYHVAETLLLTKDDSALHFTGSGWRETIIDGGREIGPFRQGEGGLWVADVPKGVTFEQLWVDDRRATRARTPNEGLYAYMREPDDKDPCGSFCVRPDDLAPLAGLAADELAKVMVAYWQSWDMGYAAVRAIDPKTGHVTTSRKGGRRYFFWDKTCPRFIFENVRSALDAPGEWFLDEKKGQLLYMPRPGETLGKTRAYAPVVETILRVTGDAAKGEFVRDVAFTGIGFEFSRLDIAPNGIANSQSANNVRSAAIEALAADGLVFRDCRVAHTGAHGVWLKGGSTRSSIVHSLIEDLGAGGVYFGDQKAFFDAPQRNTTHMTLHDSIVRHGGRILNGAVGVWLGQVADCSVTHNEIADFLYTGVSMGWNWGYQKTVTRRNHVDFNHIHHIQQGRLSDGGGFYSLGNQEGSTVCNNWVHDVNGYRDNGSPAWGLYTDEGSAHILLANNLVERCRSGAIHQHYGTENTYANNILATFDEFGVWRSRTENHVTIRVMNNIFWWTNPKAGTYVCHSHGPVKDIPADGNIYWCTAGAPSATAYNGDSWENWLKGGKDAWGGVADPLFVDPARGDWNLRSDSPALKAGFKPFDWHQAGVLASDPTWRKTAAECTWDVFKDAPPAPPFCRERAAIDFEGIGLGVLRNAMDGLAPLHASQGAPGGIEVIADAAQGKRAIRFTEVDNLPREFFPMASLSCRIVEGVAHLRFSVKGDARCNVAFESRDYDSPGKPFHTGPVMYLSGETFKAGGRALAKIPVGTWADVDFALTLSGPKKGEWTAKVTPRGGETKSITLPRGNDATFNRLTWFGFISYGPKKSTWALDNIHLWKE